VVVDDFFARPFAIGLSRLFPSSVKENTTIAQGADSSELEGGHDSLEVAGEKLDRYLEAPAFLDWVSIVSGIQGLVYEADSSAVRLEEAFHGQSLMPYAGFGFHPKTHKRRRLKMIVFLNETWKAEWRGAVRLYSNPPDGREERQATVLPAFNRCVLLETGETRWQGFDTISLPEEKRALSRKALIVSFYTNQPSLDRSPATPSLPRINRLRREINDLIELNQRLEAGRASAVLRMQVDNSTATAPCIPILGYATIVDVASGLYEDGWMAQTLVFSVEAVRRATGFTLKAQVPQHLPPNTTLEIFKDERLLCSRTIQSATELDLWCPFALEAKETTVFRIALSQWFVPTELDLSQDVRHLTLLRPTIVFEH